jgi:hypothetical protein
MEKYSFIDIEKMKATTAARKHALKLLKQGGNGSGWRKIGRESVSKVAIAPSSDEVISGTQQEFYYTYGGHFVNSENRFSSVTGEVYPPNRNKNTHEFFNFKVIPAKVG